MTEGDVVRGNFFYAGSGNRQNVALAAKMGKTPTQTLRSLHKFRQMKSLKYIALATIVMLSGCTYGSQYEADAACSKWIEQGGFYTERFTDVTFSVITFANEEKTVEKKEPLRYCREEKETNQILGFEMKTIKNGQLVEREYNKNYGAEVVKRFRY